MLAAILQNLASHPDNRTYMYRAELAGTTALQRVLEGPCYAEATESTATVLAGRVVTNSPGTHSCRPQNHKQLSTGRCGTATDPTSVSPPGHCESPTLEASEVPNCPARSSGTLNKSLDTALTSGALMRPKVLFPSITKGTAGLLAARPSRFTGQYTKESPTHSPSAAAATSPASPASPGQQGRPIASPHTAGHPPGASAGGRAMPKSAASGRTQRSRAATSVAGVPGSPLHASDSREQFLMWCVKGNVLLLLQQWWLMLVTVLARTHLQQLVKIMVTCCYRAVLLWDLGWCMIPWRHRLTLGLR